MPRGYPSEFRERALSLVEQGRPVAQVAADLGVSAQAIYLWRHERLVDTGARPGVSSEQNAELTAARRRIRELEAQVAILQRASAELRKVVPPKAKYPVIAGMGEDGLPVQLACRLLDVSESGYYEWRNRPPSAREIRHAWLTDVIGEIHTASNGIYGARRIHAELVQGRGITVGHGAVRMLMAKAGWHGLPAGRRRRNAPRLPTAADLVDRRFARPAPDLLWVADFERHEALSNRVGVGDLHRWAVAAVW